jgi:hypothetical protein
MAFFMILSYTSSLDVKQVPFHILFIILMFSYSNFIINDFFIRVQNLSKQRTDYEIKLQILFLHSINDDKIYMKISKKC